jgi:5-methylcytosine-specific restriction endonuclease McrA
MKAYYKEKSKEDLERIVENSNTFAEVMRKLGYSGNRGNSVNGVKKYLTELNIDLSRFSKKNINRYSHPSYTLDEIMVKNSSYTNFFRLKKRIINENLIEYKCSICGIENWNNKPIVLQLDHINGNNRDNRIENLRFLCPNCHSQTETFCGKNKKGR